MALEYLASANGDFDLTSMVQVYSATPRAAASSRYDLIVDIGDGAKNLDGSGGIFQFATFIGSAAVNPCPQYVSFGSAATARQIVQNLHVLSAEPVTLKMLSPNAADSDVDVTVRLVDVDALPELSATGVEAVLDAVMEEMAAKRVFDISPDALTLTLYKADDTTVRATRTVARAAGATEIILS